MSDLPIFKDLGVAYNVINIDFAFMLPNHHTLIKMPHNLRILGYLVQWLSLIHI